MHEPEKPDYIFTVRGKVQPPEKHERWERRMDANGVIFSPCSVPGEFPYLECIACFWANQRSNPTATPNGVSYKTPEDSGSMMSPATSHRYVRSPNPLPSSPFAQISRPIATTHLERGNLPSFPSPTPFFSTPRLGAAMNFQANSALSLAASTPGIVADTDFEGSSPAPWNDAAHEAMCAIGLPGSITDGPLGTGFVYLQQEAQDLEQGLFVMEQLHGADDPQTLRLMARLFMVLVHQGRYKSAEMFGRRRFHQHRSRGDPREASRALLDLADVFLLQHELEKAEVAATKAYDMVQTVDRYGDCCSFRARQSLSDVYSARGQFQRAEAILIDLLEHADGVVGSGSNHVRVDIMIGISGTLKGQRRWAEAEEWAAKGVKMCTELDAGNTFSCCSARLTLASILECQAKYDEAEEIGLECIPACRKRYGLEHPKTAAWMETMGRIYTRQGRWGKAELCLQASIDVRRKVLGPNHPLLLDPMASMAYLYVEQELWDQAEAALNSFQPIWRTFAFLSVLESAVIDARGRHSQALEIGREPAREIEASNHKQGPYANTVVVRILRNLGRLEESEELASRTIDCGTSLFGPKHPEVARCMDNLARTQMARGEAAKAVHLMEDCVQSFTASVGPEHYLTLKSQETLEEWTKLGGQDSMLPEVVPMEYDAWLAL